MSEAARVAYLGDGADADADERWGEPAHHRVVADDTVGIIARSLRPVTPSAVRRETIAGSSLQEARSSTGTSDLWPPA